MSFAALLLMVACCFLNQDEDPRELSGLSAQDAAAIKDNETLDPSSSQFKKLLYRTGTVDGDVLQEWASRSKNVVTEQLSATPNQYRFHPFSVNGSAISIHPFNFAPKDAKDFLSGFYYVNCQTKEGDHFILVSRSSIASWPLDQELTEPQQIQFGGFFLGNFQVELGQSKPSAACPVFVARRFSWYPEQENESLKIDAGKVALAQAGVDISLLDIVKSRKGKPIGIRESTCYWQMLAATKKLATTDLGSRIDFATMLRRPIDSVGKAASVQGRVRQCVPVKVTEAEPIKLLGTDTWYQITLFPDLDGRPIEVGTPDGEPEVYQNAFPVTVCVLDLPPGFTPESIVGSSFLCDGFFYRIWSYPSERTDKSSLAGQPSPLMMAASMIQVKSASGQLQTLLTAILLAMAVAVAFVGWFVYRSKKSNSKKELPEQIEAW